MSVSLYGSGQTVLQTLQSTTTTTFSTTSTSYVSSGISASITPQATTSKVLVTVTLNNIYNNAGGANYYTVYRGGTNIAGSGNNLSVWYIGTTEGSCCFQYLDTPSTTSSTTYTIYMYVTSGTGYISIGSGYLSSITLQEISGS